jgi:hypothetical protein
MARLLRELTIAAGRKTTVHKVNATIAIRSGVIR